VQKFAWRGQVMPLPFSVHVPAESPPGEIVGIASVGEGTELILSFEFRMVIDQK
jgi:hypothetical protein